MNEFVYVAINKSMPGLLKVGYTTRAPRDRLRELHTTGVPTPFHPIAVLKVPDGAAAERAAHNALLRFRKDQNREFFKVTPVVAVPLILKAVGNYEIDWSNTPNKEGIVELDNLRTLYLADEDKKERHRRSMEISDLQRQMMALESEIEGFIEERRRLGPKPAQYKGSSLEGLLFIIWCPTGLGWILWLLGIRSVLDPKMRDLGLWCFITMAVSFVIWYPLHEGEKKHKASTEPFAALDEKIAKATASRAELIAKQAQLETKR